MVNVKVPTYKPNQANIFQTFWSPMAAVGPILCWGWGNVFETAAAGWLDPPLGSSSSLLAGSLPCSSRLMNLSLSCWTDELQQAIRNLHCTESSHSVAHFSFHLGTWVGSTPGESSGNLASAAFGIVTSHISSPV